MSEPRPEAPTAPQAPVAPSVRRGLRDGELSVRSGAAGKSASFDAETGTFEFTLASGKPVKSERFFQADDDDGARWHPVEEQLDIRGAEELDSLVGASILDSHYYYALEAIVGVIESARLEGGKLVCVGRLSQREGVKDIAVDIADGIIRSVSVGFDIVEQAITQRAGRVPLVTIKRWKPREASLVAAPADNTARIRSGAPTVSDTKTPEAEAEVTTAVVETETVEAIQAELDAARSALAVAEGKLAARSAAPPAKVTAAPSAELKRKAEVDALRSMAVKAAAPIALDLPASGSLWMADISASRVLYVGHAAQMGSLQGEAARAVMFPIRAGTLTVALTDARQASLRVLGDADFDLTLLAAATVDGTG